MQEDKDHGGHTFKKIGNGKMLDHVKEILNTGTMVGLKGELSHEFIRVKMLFTKIWGVGKEKAELLYGCGMRTIENIREVLSGRKENARVLEMFENSPRIKIGLRLYEDLEKRIPRAEVR